jgi:CIC family chloride channel protein
MVCEMAGTYDLLPSLMLTSGLAFVLLRRVNLYSKQPVSRFQSPAHAGEESLDVLKRLKVADVFRHEGMVMLQTRQALASLVDAIAGAPDWQDSFPVLDEAGVLRGIVSSDVIRTTMKEDTAGLLIIAADVMLPAVHVGPQDDLHTALERFLGSGLHEIPVVDDGNVVGLLDEAHITRAYHDYHGRLAGDGDRGLSMVPQSRMDVNQSE